VTFLDITISKEELDTKHSGYQSPIPIGEVKEVVFTSFPLVSSVVFTASPLVSSVVFTSTPLVSSVIKTEITRERANNTGKGKGRRRGKGKGLLHSFRVYF
jgi:hypothetical protein